MAASELTCARPPTPQVAGGVGSSNPRLHHHGGGVGVCCVFVLCVVVSPGHHHSSYVDKYQKITLRWGYRHYLVSHPGLYHTSHGTGAGRHVRRVLGMLGGRWASLVCSPQQGASYSLSMMSLVTCIGGDGDGSCCICTFEVAVLVNIFPLWP